MLGGKKAELEAEIDKVKEVNAVTEKKNRVANKLDSYATDGLIRELTREIVQEFADKVIIYDAEHIEISWSFTDLFS